MKSEQRSKCSPPRARFGPQGFPAPAMPNRKRRKTQPEPPANPDWQPEQYRRLEAWRSRYPRGVSSEETSKGCFRQAQYVEGMRKGEDREQARKPALFQCETELQPLSSVRAGMSLHYRRSGEGLEMAGFVPHYNSMMICGRPVQAAGPGFSLAPAWPPQPFCAARRPFVPLF